MALISIVMVAYNAAVLLPKALRQISVQTFDDFEFVFVDNGSTDDTAKLFLEFCESFPHIHTQFSRIEVNDGLPNGRNRGLSMAGGNYVMFHDADDWMDEDCLEALGKVIETHKPQRIIQQVRFLDDTETELDQLTYPENASRWSKNSLQGDLFQRQIIEDNHLSFAKDAYYDDFYFTNLFNSVSQNAFFLHETHYNMLMHVHSMTHRYGARPGYFAPRLEKTFQAMRGIAEKLSTRDSVLYEYNCIQRYYSDVFRGAGMSLKQKIHEYSVFKKIMEKYYPNYLANKNVKLRAPNGFEGHFKRNIWLCIRAEKVDRILHAPVIMDFILTVYHVAIKTGVYRYVG